MGAQGLSRATDDIDLFVAPDLENIEKIKRALRKVFPDESIDEISSDDLSGDYPVIRYGPPDHSYIIDLIAKVGDAFSFEEIESEEMLIEGICIKVATPRMLYRLKRDTIRPLDRFDADAIRRRFDLREED